MNRRERRHSDTIKTLDTIKIGQRQRLSHEHEWEGHDFSRALHLILRFSGLW